MKTKIITIDGSTSIVLTPESEFEEDLIEKIVDSRPEYHISTRVTTQSQYGIHSNHTIDIDLIKNKI